MWEILSRAISFLGIILLGYVLRRKNYFHEDDFKVLSKIVVRITLPGAIISSFAGKEIDISMLMICLLGMAGSIICMLLMNFRYLRDAKGKRAFAVLNCSGYNIGNFTLPFVQSFLGPAGVITASLFDTGNSVICLGGAYSVAAAIKGEAKGNPVKRIASSLLKSIPFICFMIMIVVCLLQIPLPSLVTNLAGIAGNANAFVAMLMLGIGFKLSGDRKQIGMIVEILLVRYLIALGLSVAFYRWLPLPLDIRQTLAVVVFAPIGSIIPAFTQELKEDVGLSSALNSISIICSMVCMVAVLFVIQL